MRSGRRGTAIYEFWLQLMPTGAERLIWGFGGAEDVKGKILETTFLKSKLSAKLSGT